jgi:hypothetical protein
LSVRAVRVRDWSTSGRVASATTTWTERRGVLVAIFDDGDRVGLGEAPLPAVSTTSLRSSARELTFARRTKRLGQAARGLAGARTSAARSSCARGRGPGEPSAVCDETALADLASPEPIGPSAWSRRTRPSPSEVVSSVPSTTEPSSGRWQPRARRSPREAEGVGRRSEDESSVRSWALRQSAIRSHERRRVTRGARRAVFTAPRGGLVVEERRPAPALSFAPRGSPTSRFVRRAAASVPRGDGARGL